MSDSFGRHISVQVGPPGKEGRAWTQLRTVFKVTKTTGRQPNKTQLQIYNLSADSSAYIREKGNVLRLMAGYDLPGQIFLGDVDTAIRVSQPPDIITKIEAQDGGRKFRTSRFDRNYAPGTTWQTVFRDILDALDLPVGFMPDPPPLVFGRGVAFQGYIRDTLDRMVQLLGAEWFIVDEALQIMPAAANTGEGPLISPWTGMVGSPEPYIDEKKRAGVFLTTLLNDKLNPGVRFELYSRDFKGYYRVDEVEHSGDTHGEEWYSRVKARLFQ